MYFKVVLGKYVYIQAKGRRDLSTLQDIVLKTLYSDFMFSSCYKTEAGKPKKAGPISNATPGMLGRNLSLIIATLER